MGKKITFFLLELGLPIPNFCQWRSTTHEDDLCVRVLVSHTHSMHIRGGKLVENVELFNLKSRH
jgi:hypothetical protein